MDKDCWTALSVRQPFASLIILGIKRYEARTWYPSSFGTVLIHASSQFARGWKNDPVILAAFAGLKMSEADIRALPTSAIIGSVEATSVIMPGDSKSRKNITLLDSWLSSMDESWCLWQLAKPKRFKHPIKCKGALNLWSVPDATIRKVLADNSLE